MQYVLFGLAALLVALLLLRLYTGISPQVLARWLRIGTGVVVLAGAFILVLRGAIGYALVLAALGWWLLWGGGNPWGGLGNPQKSPGQTSRITTEHLEVELDHDTGEIRGRVLKGLFAASPIRSRPRSWRPISTARTPPGARTWLAPRARARAPTAK